MKAGAKKVTKPVDAKRKDDKRKEDKRAKVHKPESDGDSDDSGGSGDEDGDGGKKGRSTKHAPKEMSSKRAVGRKREAITVPKATARDPRFDSVTGVLDRDKVRKNYKFLDDYVDSEIKELKTKLKEQKAPVQGSNKKNKNKKGAAAAAAAAAPKLSAEEIEEMKRELVQKQSKKQAQDARDRQQEVIREHKKKEKELVKEGKTPYFLKNSDVKKEVIVKQFEGLSEGKREKVMERKRKKMASKERKGMPWERRVQDS
jgi:ribosomal RNA-processing protein 36